MMTDISSETANTAGASADTTSQTVEIQNQTADTGASNLEPQQTKQNSIAENIAAKAAAKVIPAQQSSVPTFTPNFKYKAAGQEKEIDPLFHGIIKDADTEAKVKDIFSKIDAFDYMKSKSSNMEKEFGSLMGDYEEISGTVEKFNKAVAGNDLTSAFRLANITKEQIFKWTQQELRRMDMSPEERQQYEEVEQTRQHKSELEERVQQIQQQYEHQAVQARTMQLEMVVSRPDVAKFAEAWDQNSGESGSFKAFVAEEARKVYYDQGVDLSSEQAVAHVMKRFGKFLNVGETAAQSPQAIMQTQSQKPVIPHIQGKAASPIKKVARSLDELKALAKTM